MRYLLPLLLAACQCPTPPVLFPVAEITTAGGERATATYLGSDVWATNQHVLGDNTHGTLLFSNVVLRSIDRGHGPTVGGDWVTFRAEPSVRVPVLPHDFATEVPVGATVWVVGFGTPDRDVPYRSNLVRAIVRPALFPEGENVLTLSFCYKPDAIYYGMSGGAVIYEGRVVAILSGRARYGEEVRQLAVRPKVE